MASQPVARLTRCGILAIRDGNLQMSPAFTQHVHVHQARGRVPAWDTLAVLEQAVASWHEYAGDARESARQLVRFLPQTVLHAPLSTAGYPVLDAFIAA